MNLGGVGGDLDILAREFGVLSAAKLRSACGSVGSGEFARDIARCLATVLTVSTPY
jgi:hypothetical protein